MEDYKKIWITDDYPDDHQFFLKVFGGNGKVFLGWEKYRKNRLGKWTLVSRRGATIADSRCPYKKQLYPFYIKIKEYEDIYKCINNN